MNPVDMMPFLGDAIGEAFGDTLAEIVEPLVDRIDILTDTIAHLHVQITDMKAQQDVLAMAVERAKTQGGMIGKLLGG